MDEQASFEPRSVLPPRRARASRLLLLVPVLVLAATVLGGVIGARSDHAVADVPEASAATEPSTDSVGSPQAVAPQLRDVRFPAQVLGLEVKRLDDIEVGGLGRDAVSVVAGWYVATGITDCPPLDAVFRTTSVPELGNPVDEWAFCKRSGMLFASGPNLDSSLPTNNAESDQSTDPARSPIPVTLVTGVVVPPELEMIGAPATPVVVIGRFVNIDNACPLRAGCRAELIVDHVAWAPGH